MYKAAHSFQAKFTRDTDDQTPDFKHRGYKLMRKVRKWAKKWPNTVHLLSCDDSHHSTSMIVLIEHKDEKGWWGLTGYIIPQAKPEIPVQFFLYPENLAKISSKLQLILQLACIQGFR